ncbi:MAG: hypothetical protein U9Q98_03650 [Bacteroidota bacterium]|nr:hypothetical protein [Bacteroidota bacterium]
MKSRLTELKAWNQQNNYTQNTVVPQVVVNITGNITGKGSINLSYLVTNAGWNASYDIRANENEEINLVSLAVKITRNNTETSMKPQIRKWFA